MQVTANYFLHNSYTNKNPKFKANYGVITDNCGNLLYRKTTSWFRGDMAWHQVAEKLKDIRHIVLYGCSSGEEAFTMAISALRRYGEGFFKEHPPIIARDIDEESIINAKKGIYYIDDIEKSLIESALADILPEKYYKQNVYDMYMARTINNAETAQRNINKYVKITKALPDELSAKGLSPEKNKYRLDIQPALEEKVIFSKGDILEDVEKLPDKRVMLGARNFWPYLEGTKQIPLLQRISQKYRGTNSRIMFGEYDNPYDYSTMYPQFNGKFTDNGSLVKRGLEEYGYRKTEVKNIFDI